jgi:hypothetical protein
LNVEFTLLSCASLASNFDWSRRLAEFVDNFADEGMRFVCHPAAMSFTPATEEGSAMRPLALADDGVVRAAASTTVGQLHRKTAQEVGYWIASLGPAGGG